MVLNQTIFYEVELYFCLNHIINQKIFWRIFCIEQSMMV